MTRYSGKVSSVNIYQNLLKSARESKEDEQNRNRSVIKKLFRWVYFIVKMKWAAIENFEHVVRFVASLGVEDLMNHINNAESKATYLSSTTVTELISLISTYLERGLLNSIRSQKYSILADASTDKANRTQLLIFCRWMDMLKVKDHYLGLVHAEKTTAEALMDIIKRFLMAKGIDVSDIRFSGFDGCNTMSGEVKGLQRRIRHLSPYSIYVNCRNHRLALCLVHLMKHADYGILVDVDATLLAIWKMFHYSPQKMAVFAQMQSVYGLMTLTINRAAATRWLSHLKACTRVIERYECLVDCLDQLYTDRKEPEIFGIRNNLLSRDFLCMILLLGDVLKPVNVLSLYLQEAEVNFTYLAQRVKTTTQLEDLIEMYQNRNYIDNANSLFSKYEHLFEVIIEHTDLARRLRGDRNAPAADYTADDFLRDVGIPFVYSLMSEIDTAFQCSPVLKSFGVLEPRNIPESVADLPDYGSEAIHTLADFYGNHPNDTFQRHVNHVISDFDSAQAIEIELEAFRHQLYMLRQRGCDTLAGLHEEFTRDNVLQACFPRVQKLVLYAMLIPASTAPVERGFSLMNDLCTSLRSSLKQDNLDALMRICREGPTELTDNDLTFLVEEFKNSKARKIIL